MEQAKQLMSEVANPKKNITLYLNDSPGHKDIAVAIQAAWKELGITSTIKQQEFAQFLEFLGPPPNDDVDVYRLGWIGDFVDAINFLDLWTCKSGNNNTNCCNKEYDAADREGEEHPGQRRPATSSTGRPRTSSSARTATMPVMPIYWYTYINLERENVKDTFNVNLLDQTDLTKVVVTEVDALRRTGGRGRAAPPPFGDTADRVEAADDEVHRQAHLLDDPGDSGRHLPDVHDDAADRRQPFPALASGRCRRPCRPTSSGSSISMIPGGSSTRTT